MQQTVKWRTKTFLFVLREEKYWFRQITCRRKYVPQLVTEFELNFIYKDDFVSIFLHPGSKINI